MWCTSFTQDLTGREVGYALEDVKRRRPAVVVGDFPPKAPWERWIEALRAESYLCDAQEVIATQHGDVVAVNRVIVHAEKCDSQQSTSSVSVLGALASQDRPCGVIGALRVAEQGEELQWLSQSDWQITIDPKIKTTGDIMMPWPRGKVKSRESGEAHLFYNPMGPAPTPVMRRVGDGEVRGGLFLCPGGSGTGIRPLTNYEWLAAWGIVDSPKQRWSVSDLGAGVLLSMAVRSAPPCLVRAVAHRTATRVVESILRQQKVQKVGMCVQPEEEAVRARARQWFKAWRQDQDWPSSQWGIPRREELVANGTLGTTERVDLGKPRRLEVGRLAGSS